MSPMIQLYHVNNLYSLYNTFFLTVRPFVIFCSPPAVLYKIKLETLLKLFPLLKSGLVSRHGCLSL